MTRVDEFDHFYSSTSGTTLRATYAVCGDRNVALEATVDAYRHAWRDWNKIRHHEPDAWVRTEAWRLTALSRSTHPLRQRQEEDSDRELLSALAKLRVDDRRLIALLTLGAVDLEDACHEVGVPAQQGAESVTTALTGLESTLGDPLEQLEERMHRLSNVTRKLTLPAAGVVRHRAQLGRRRNTIALVAGAVMITLGGGLVAASEPSDADRHRIGDRMEDPVLLAQRLGAHDLLAASQVARLDPNAQWKVLGTNDDAGERTPYSTCPPRRFADRDGVRGLVRTFQAGRTAERVAQAVEVSRNSDRAMASFRRQEQWYADCRLPGVQLTGAWIVRRADPDFRVLQLVSHQEPEQTFTVGIGVTGTVVTTLVHRSAGEEGPDLWAFARVLNEAVGGVCEFGGRRCESGLVLRRTPPPATRQSPRFLAIADLPPVGDATAVWTGVPSDPKSHRDAAVCDKAEFTGAHATSRSYVQSEVADLPKAFGVTETVGRFPTEDRAKEFIKAVEHNLARCPDKNLAAQVDQEHDVDDLDGTSWRVRLELPDGGEAQYRTAVVREGRTVAHVTFTPAGRYAISRKVFERLVDRAGQRLQY
ncbi:MAG TPA: hypothetical protein VM093_03600 [Aeromicrobium sp.]|nr:hypothetical protein [Aeromicrobium sp.]